MEPSTLRLLIFVAVLGSMLLLERLLPRRSQAPERARRWSANFGVQLVNLLCLRLLFPGAAVGVSYWAEQQQLGLLQGAAIWWALPLCLLLLDLAIYAQHVASHKWAWLWRLHRMHHSDTFIDASTALRFHPLEILLSMVWKSALIIALGAPVLAVLIFETLLNASALFNHANLRLPAALDRLLRWIIVTPDMHRVHHSVHPEETDSNYGFNLPWWDRLFGTYRAQPRDGHLQMQIGLRSFRSAEDGRLDRLLLQPLRSK